jgi:membrane protease YdiL (CAAX protease family)
VGVGPSSNAAVTEEAVYRGLLIATGTRLYHLPLAIAVAASLLLFIGIHAYQGLRATLPLIFVSGLILPIYLFSNSLFPVIALHFCIDAVSLLVVPAYPSKPPVDQPGTAEATTDEPEKKQTGT